MRDGIEVARRSTRRVAFNTKPPPVAPAGVEMLYWNRFPSLPLRRVGYEYEAYYRYAYKYEREVLGTDGRLHVKFHERPFQKQSAMMYETIRGVESKVKQFFSIGKRRQCAYRSPAYR